MRAQSTTTLSRCLALGFALGALPVQAGSFWSELLDPKDGRFDVSQMLAKDLGFLPVPILITEPAIGFGGGLAAVFFHDDPEDARQREEAFKKGDDDLSAFLPPSTSVLFGAATENGSEMLGGGHLGIWQEDRIRYIGAAGYASINLAFHGIEDDSPLDSSPAYYNIEGLFLFQELKFRLWDSDWFAGGVYQYLGVDIDFDDGEAPQELDEDRLSENVSQLGFVVGYDSRDNLFSPNRGIKVDFEAMFSDEALGSGSSFQKYKLAGLFFWPAGEDLDLGFRLDGRVTRGDAPFFELPFIDLRGIPAMRYQDDVAVMSELQLTYHLNPRWSLVGFGGLGQAVDSIGAIGSGDLETTAGGGFRYLIARRLGLRSGIDVARGPEEWTVYFQVGNAW